MRIVYHKLAQRLSFSSKGSLDIYNYDKSIKQTKQLIKNDERISKADEKLIEDYDRSMIRESLAKATRLKHLQVVLNLSRLLPKDWKDVTKSDIEDLVTKVVETYSDNGQESHSSRDHKKVLRIFFRWYKLGTRDHHAGDPEETRGIHLKFVKDKVSREDLVTQDELDRLLYACGGNLRDKALIHCHAESGTRPGEILNLKIKHVKFDQYGAIIQVDGKTVPHPKRLIKSVPDLSAWINLHPFRKNPESPLWINLGKEKFGHTMSSAAARRMLQKRCEIAHIEKRMWMNLFRHTEATETAKYMTEAQMRKRHGWSNSSRMPGRYVHLINQDVDEAILSHHGVLKEEEKDRPPVPIKCQICETQNSPESETCRKCGRPFTLKTATRIDEGIEQRFSSIEEKLELLLSALPQQYQK